MFLLIFIYVCFVNGWRGFNVRKEWAQLMMKMEEIERKWKKRGLRREGHGRGNKDFGQTGETPMRVESKRERHRWKERNISIG